MGADVPSSWVLAPPLPGVARTSQPQSPVAIDWGNPLTRSLLLSCYNFPFEAGGFGPRNAATNVRGATVAPLAPATTALGISPAFNGTSSGASIGSLNLSQYPSITVAFRLWWDTFANGNEMACEYTADVNNNAGFWVTPNHSGGTGVWVLQKRGTAFNGGTFVRPSAAAWHHMSVTFTNNTGTALASTAWLDGVPVTMTQTNSDNLGSGVLADSTLYLMSRATTSLFGAGKLLNFNLWGRLLQDQERYSLYRGSWQLFANDY